MGAVYFISKSKGAVDSKRFTTTEIQYKIYSLATIVIHSNKSHD